MADPFAGLDWNLVREAERTAREAEDAKRKLSEAVLALSPFQKNDVIRDKETGARYRVDGGHGYVSSGRPKLLLHGYRVYTTGRREARSSTWLDWNNMEKVKDGL